jgi:redox-sensitive bicupin YhaK (pirin superfamily)
LKGCRASIAAGYGPLSKAPQPFPRDRMIWILDGYAEIHDSDGKVLNISQGESTVLASGRAYRLVFPQLTIYLRVETTESA